ncbi:MMPL family transporter [Alkalicoccus chagannorensis]|uniref:MMPL/RND family transporter n=1 Tax=Alkalicoccus chagannorensis TaxID=427072 RepID=UPI0004000F96|nr:MMPL family transporter [Alkalicoccus chagannorensis]
MKKWIWIFPFLWIIVGTVLFLTSPDMDQLVREEGQFDIPEGYPTAVTDELLASHGASGGEDILYVYYDEDGLSSPQLSELENHLQQFPEEISGFGVEDTAHPFMEEGGSALISEDETTAMAIITMDMSLNDVPLIREELELAAEVDQTSVFVSGSPIIEDDVIISSEEGLATTEVITVIFVIAVLLLVFRSVTAPFVPLITVGAAYLVTVPIVSFLIDQAGFPVSNFTQIFIVAILFGIGTDYCILVLNRFKEELAVSSTREEAVTRTMKAVGPTVLSSAVTGFIGFAAIGLADFDLYQSASGVAVGIAVLVLAITVWVPPALLLFGSRIFWPSKRTLEDTDSRIWKGLGTFALLRPGWTSLILIALVVPSFLFYEQRLSFESLDEIDRDTPSVQAVDLVAEKFGPGDAFPGQVVVSSPDSFRNSEKLSLVEQLSGQLSQLDGVGEVRSLTRPDGSTIDDFRMSRLMDESADGLDELIDGTASLYEGLEELQDGLYEAAADLQADTGELSGGQSETAAGTEQAAAAVQEAAGASAQTASEQRSIAGGLEETAAGLEQTASQLPPEQQQQLLASAGGLNESASGLRAAADGLEELADGQEETAAGLEDLAASQEDLADGTAELSEALAGAASGYEETADELDDVLEGTAEIEEGLEELYDLQREIASAEGYASEGFFVPEEALEELDDVFDVYAAPDEEAALFDIILDVDPYSNEAMEVMGAVQSQTGTALGSSDDEMTYSIGGLPAVNADLSDISDADFVRTAVIMLGGIFLVLTLMLRSLIMPAYILASLSGTYIIAMAVTEAIFVVGFGYPGISWAVPFFGFVMLMALGVDYSIFLMARFNENAGSLPVREAMQAAMTKIGTVILSAAVILAGTFGAMMPSGVLSLVQIGTLVLTGLLLYAFVMLPLFVPLMAKWFQRANWLPFAPPAPRQNKDRGGKE